MIIPDGEWFCPPCEQKLLCEKLDEKLQDLDSHLKKKERAERRRERLVFVGISLDNIIPSMEPEVEAPPEEKKKSSKKSPATERRSTRARKLISYRFDDFDEAIDEAIEEDVREADGGGGGKGKDMSNIIGHRGKDMSAILQQEGEERQESRRPQRAAACRKKRRRLNDLDSDSSFDDDESEDEFKISESSQDDFVVSEECEDSEDHVISDDSDYNARRPRWRFVKPMKRSRRLHRRRIKRRRRRRRYSDDDGEESDSDDDDKSLQSLASSDYSSDFLDRRRRSKRNQAKQVNYREDSDTEEGSVNSNIGRRPLRRILKPQLSSSDSNDEGLRTGRLEKKSRLRRLHSDESEEEDERTTKKRFNRIETDEEEEEKAKSDNFVSDNSSSFLQETSKKHPFRIESDDDDDFDNVKDESPLDYSLVDLPSANGHSPGKAIENLIGKSGNKTLVSKDSISHPILEPNGLGQEAVGLEEDEDELLRVTDLVDYVCNSEQL
ncbi:remodeling and spacing factor 1 [Protopterus annectens]|uniref:remodeling and spacing factor 1 n=1 Tax=Protopterus annectens TaxID=7888 RepID=UPI001CFBE93D|nr:remodeling and spacing factor 1 [Protopterus annectens]